MRSASPAPSSWPEQDGVGVGAVLGVQRDDLELRHEQIGQGDRERIAIEVLADRQDVAHLEGVDEDIDLAAVLLVVEEQPARAVHRVERAVGDVALRLEERPRAPSVPLARDEIDVADLAHEGRIEICSAVQANGGAADQAHSQAGLVGCRHETACLLHDIGQDRRCHVRTAAAQDGRGVIVGQCIHGHLIVPGRDLSPSRTGGGPSRRRG